MRGLRLSAPDCVHRGPLSVRFPISKKVDSRLIVLHCVK